MTEIPAVPVIHRNTPRRALVVGGGISGLLAALDLQEAGWQVSVYEAAAIFGGCVGAHEVAGIRLDSGAEAFATRSAAVADLAQELGLGESIVAPNPVGAWVWLPQGPVPLPRTGLLGIPSDVQAAEVREALGKSGVRRAALDATMPASIGTTEATMSVAELVRARMGERVLERLVAPVVRGIHSADPELLDVDMVAPGLRAGIRQHGSLAAAVAAQRVHDFKPGSAVGGLRGGMHTLVAALVARLGAAGVALNAGYVVTKIGRAIANNSSRSSSEASPRWTIDWIDGEVRGSESVELLVMATDGPTAVKLLAQEVPELLPYAPAPGPDIRIATLVVNMPELDSHPRGTGALVAPQAAGITAKALTHSTAKWNWLADSTSPGIHVLRLSYGPPAAPPAGAAAADPGRTFEGNIPVSEDDELIKLALADSSKLLDVCITEDAVIGADIVRWKGALSFAAVGHQGKIAQIHALAQKQAGLVLVGGWMSGNGLAAVVAGTRRQIKALVDATG